MAERFEFLREAGEFQAHAVERRRRRIRHSGSCEAFAVVGQPCENFVQPVLDPRDAVGLRGLGGRLLFGVDPVRQRREAMLEVGKRGGERGEIGPSLACWSSRSRRVSTAASDLRTTPSCSLPAVECCWMASILAVTSASASRTASEARSCAVATPTISSRIVVSVRSTESIRACIAAAVLPSTASARRRPSRTAVSTRDARWAVGSFGEGGGLAGLRLAMRRDRRSSGEPGATLYADPADDPVTEPRGWADAASSCALAMTEFSHSPSVIPARRAASLAVSRASGPTPFTLQGTPCFIDALVSEGMADPGPLDDRLGRRSAHRAASGCGAGTLNCLDPNLSRYGKQRVKDRPLAINKASTKRLAVRM